MNDKRLIKSDDVELARWHVRVNRGMWE